MCTHQTSNREESHIHTHCVFLHSLCSSACQIDGFEDAPCAIWATQGMHGLEANNVAHLMSMTLAEHTHTYSHTHTLHTYVFLASFILHFGVDIDTHCVFLHSLCSSACQIDGFEDGAWKVCGQHKTWPGGQQCGPPDEHHIGRAHTHILTHYTHMCS